MKNENQKPITPDDPRLTAYALGEGTPDERAAVEAAMAADASLSEEVESIRRTADLLQTTLAAEPLPEESQSPATAAVPPTARRKSVPLRILGTTVVAACACVLVLALLPAGTFHASRETAKHYPTEEAKGQCASPDNPSSAQHDQRDRYDAGGKKRDEKPGTPSQTEFVHTLNPAEASPVIFNDKTPIAYPGPEEWDKLSQSQQKLNEKTSDTNYTVGKRVWETRTMDGQGPKDIPYTIQKPVYETKPGRAEYVDQLRRLAQEEAIYTPSKEAKEKAKSEQIGRYLARIKHLRVETRDLTKEERKELLEGKPSSALAAYDAKLYDIDGKHFWLREEEYELIRKQRSELSRAPNTEAYDRIFENEFLLVSDEPLSTFSIDVDTAAYSNMRRFLNNGTMPPKNSVRIEELVNYFPYHYSPPTEETKTPFAAHLAVAQCPWNEKHQLVRVALKGKEMQKKERPRMNLVFLLDVSGSMSSSNKLPLVKKGMTKLVEQLDERDHIGIVTYAGSSGIALDSTAADEQGKDKILAAIDRLHPGGSTNGASGIRDAYELAAENFEKEGGVNRVILCTDGDFNVGVTSDNELVKLIEKKAKSKVFLTVLGFGCGNYKDSKLEKLADKGNGNYGYIDNEDEAEKVLVREQFGTLVTIAKDVKIQVDFNPEKVKGYRLLGYENRVMAAEDFKDDTKDAGEIGAGHTVTAFYELIPAGSDETIGPIQADPSEFQSKPDEKTSKKEETVKKVPKEMSDKLLVLRLRYKQPEGDKSTEIRFPLVAPKEMPRFDQTDDDFRFGGSVVGLAMLLRDSKHKGTATYAGMLDWAEGAQGDDPHGYRREFIQLMRKAQSLSSQE